jgi:hypothetical protein
MVETDQSERGLEAAASALTRSARPWTVAVVASRAVVGAIKGKARARFEHRMSRLVLAIEDIA